MADSFLWIFLFDKPITYGITHSSQGRKVMLHDFDEINAILHSMADEGILEPMVEPIDCDDCHPMDYADVTGLWDEMYPEPVDSF
jgi:hypothetical protein